ncbi:unnamed protein product [Choristocarpus tenellus]
MGEEAVPSCAGDSFHCCGGLQDCWWGGDTYLPQHGEQLG